LEDLEARLTPTVVFHPYFGAEATTFGAGEKLNNTPVELIFWGSSYWSNPAGASAAAITQAYSTLLSGPIYQHLAQYGAGASPSLAHAWVDTDHGDPPTVFTDQEMQQEILNAINDPSSGILPPVDFAAPPLYMVVTPFGTSVDASTIHAGDGGVDAVVGYHNDFYATNGINTVNLVYGVVTQPFLVAGLGGGLTNLDQLTSTFSHESAEAMTDAQPFSGILTDAGPALPGGGAGEIGDFEPEDYNLDLYRVDGVLVQALWDFNAQAFTVSDGNSQHLDLYAHYTYNAATRTYTYTGSTLDVQGGQLGPGQNDSITVDTSPAGGVAIALDGKSFAFEPGIRITQINVVPGNGTDNTVQLNSVPAGCPVRITGNGTNNVTVGDDTNGVRDILSPVTVDNGNPTPSATGYSTLTIDDRYDETPHTATMSDSTYNASLNRGSLTGLAPAAITWLHPASLGGKPAGGVTWVSIYGGDAYGDTFNVANTGNLYNDVQLTTGFDVNTVNVNGTACFLAISSQSGSDTVNINGTSASGPVTVSVRNFGEPTINVAPRTETLSSIQGTVTVTSTEGAANLAIDDQKDTSATTYTVSGSSVSCPGAAAVHFSGVDTVLYGGSGTDTYNDQGTAAAPSARVVTGNLGTSTVNATGTVGAITLNGYFTAQLNDLSGEPSITANTGSIGTINVNSTVIAAGLGLTIQADGTYNTIVVYATNAGSTLDIFATGATVHTWLGYQSALSNIQGQVFFGGKSGTVDALYVSDTTSAPAGAAYAVTGSTIERSGFGGVEYEGLSVVDLTASSPGAVFDITGTAARTTTTVADTVNDATFDVGTGDLAALPGPLLVLDQGSDPLADTLVVDDQSAPAGQNYTLTTTSGAVTDGPSWSTVPAILRPGFGGVTYSNFAQTTLETPTAGNSKITISTPPSGPVTVNAGGTGNTLVGPTGAASWTINGAGAGNVLHVSDWRPPVAFTGITNLTGGSSSGNTFNFKNGGSIAGTINGGAGGANTLNFTEDGAAGPITVNLQTKTASPVVAHFANISQVNGNNDPGDTLIGANATNVWTLTSTNIGTVGGVGFMGFPNLTGGSSTDVFALQPGSSVTGTINGGSGSNWLDYASWTTPVTVNLAAGTATSAGSVAKIQNVRGGQSGDTLTGGAQGGILIGGSGADTIRGGTGRSLLIGDGGPDTVIGGSSSDLLIGGSTAYDASSLANDLALADLLAEWQSSDSYATRIADIKTGQGKAAGYTLAWGSTVLDDAAANILSAAPTATQDWFFQGASDTLVNDKAGEQVN
jgi:hypothetical protein